MQDELVAKLHQLEQELQGYASKGEAPPQGLLDEHFRVGHLLYQIRQSCRREEIAQCFSEVDAFLAAHSQGPTSD
jgi:hypothetical protein